MKKIKTDNPMEKWTKVMNVPFTHKNTTYVRHMTKCSALALNSKMQI